MIRTPLLALAVAAIAYAVFLFGRGYPWQLAFLAAVAIGALVYATLRTIRNVKDMTAGGESPDARGPGDGDRQ